MNTIHLSGLASNKKENLHLLAMKIKPISFGKQGLVVGEELVGVKQLNSLVVRRLRDYGIKTVGSNWELPH